MQLANRTPRTCYPLFVLPQILRMRSGRLPAVACYYTRWFPFAAWPIPTHVGMRHTRPFASLRIYDSSAAAPVAKYKCSPVEPDLFTHLGRANKAEIMRKLRRSRKIGRFLTVISHQICTICGWIVSIMAGMYFRDPTFSP